MFFYTPKGIINEVQVDGQELNPNNNQDNTDYTENLEPDTNTEPEDYTIPEDADPNNNNNDTDNTENDTKDYTDNIDENDDNTENENNEEDNDTTDYADDTGDDANNIEENNDNEEDNDYVEDGNTTDDDNSNEIMELDKEIFKDLSEEELNIKSNSLRKKFLELYDICSNAITSMDTVEKIPSNLSAVDFIINNLNELRTMIMDYIDDIFNIKSYIENCIYYNKCVAVLNGLKKVINELKSENN